jgi:hypothetical protein
MKILVYILVLTLYYSCNGSRSEQKEPLLTRQPTSNQAAADSVFTFEYQINFADKNITNKSDRKVDLLFNGIDNYFGGHESPIVRFSTECMRCQPVQEFQGGVLFGKRLLITRNNIKYHKADFDIPDSINRIAVFSDRRERTNPKFNFQEGNGSIKYIGISCNDTHFNKVRLTFPSGDIIIDSLINAAFFEYDLDADGKKEQYLLGFRNCSQELAALRIRP